MRAYLSRRAAITRRIGLTTCVAALIPILQSVQVNSHSTPVSPEMQRYIYYLRRVGTDSCRQWLENCQIISFIGLHNSIRQDFLGPEHPFSNALEAGHDKLTHAVSRVQKGIRKTSKEAKIEKVLKIFTWFGVFQIGFFVLVFSECLQAEKGLLHIWCCLGQVQQQQY